MSKPKDGYTREQMDSHAAYARARRAKMTPEQKMAVAATSRQWYLRRTPEQKAAQVESMRLRYARMTQEQKATNAEKRRRQEYDLEPVDYAAMLAAQTGRCAICTVPLQVPYVDHCHVTGRVRGLLCGRCNLGIGMLGDNLAGVQAAADYLSAP